MAKILITDDTQTIHAIMKKHMGALGHDTVSVFNGLEAVERVKKEPFDLVLMDLNMPVMNGFEATRKIREIKKDQFLPIIIVSTLEEKENIERGLMREGANDFIHKPFDPLTLQVRVSNMLKLKEKHDQLREAREKLSAHAIEIEALLTEGLVNMRDPLSILKENLEASTSEQERPDFERFSAMRRETKKIEETVEQISRIHRNKYTKIREL